MNNFKYIVCFFHASFPDTPVQSRRKISLGISQNQGFCTMKCLASGGMGDRELRLNNCLLHN